MKTETELDKLQVGLDGLGESMDALVAERDDLAAQVTRLREALENHIEVVALKREDYDTEDYEFVLSELADSARATLAQPGAAVETRS